MKNIVIIDCGPSFSEVSQQFGCATDWIIKILQNKKCKFKCVKAYKAETISQEEGDAWIITGSPESVYNELDWMLDLEEKIRFISIINKPLLGICFGHQLIAKAFGGNVKLNPEGWELGAYPIRLTSKGLISKIFYQFNNYPIVYESHQDCVTELPKEAVELACNNKGNQAFKIHHNIYGVQFHPEFSWEVIKKYASIRIALGVVVEDPLITSSKDGQRVLHNFIDLVL